MQTVTGSKYKIIKIKKKKSEAALRGTKDYEGHNSQRQLITIMEERIEQGQELYTYNKYKGWEIC